MELNGPDQPTDANRQQYYGYVDQGGSLYASDWAYYFVESAYPDLLDFHGDDATVGEAFHGAPGSFTAAVVDTNMQGLLGSNTASIWFNYNAWAVAQGRSRCQSLGQGRYELEDGTVISESHSVRLRGTGHLYRLPQ